MQCNAEINSKKHDCCRVKNVWYRGNVVATTSVVRVFSLTLGILFSATWHFWTLKMLVWDFQALGPCRESARLQAWTVWTTSWSCKSPIWSAESGAFEKREVHFTLETSGTTKT